MADEKDIINFGEWKCPRSWNEVTLKQFQEIEAYYDGKDKDFDVREVMHIFCGKSIDEVNALPVEFIDTIMTNLLFLQEKPVEGKPSNSIVIGGVTYMVNIMEKLKVGEYVAVDTVMKGDKHNYAAILAILCRKEGEKYDSRFEAEVLDGRIKMYEGVSVVDVLPVIGFFLECYMTSVLPSLLSSRIREGISHIRRDIETSERNGEVSRRSMKSQMRKLRKLEKYLDSI